MEPISNAIRPLRKITPKDVMGENGNQLMARIYDIELDEETKAVKYTPKGQVDLLIVYGKARDFDTGETEFGNYVKYQGQFRAKRLHDGAMFEAANCIFDAFTNDIFTNAFLAAKADGGDNFEALEFAFVIGIEPHVRGEESKYRFTCQPIQTGTDTVNPLKELEAMLGEKLPALMAPQGAAAIEDKSKGKGSK